MADITIYIRAPPLAVYSSSWDCLHGYVAELGVPSSRD